MESVIWRVASHALILNVLLVCHAANATAPVFGTATESKYAREFTPPKNKSVIYIYQSRTGSRGASPTVWLNNYEIGRLVPGAFTVWKLAPGRVNLRVGEVGAATYSMISQAGKIYRFRISVTHTANGPVAELTRMPASARSEMAGMQLIKNPRQLQPAIVQVPSKPTKSKPAKPPQPQVKPERKAKPAKRSEPERRVAIRPGGYGLMIKGGALTLAEDIQTLIGNDYQFDDSASGPFGVEVYYQYPTGVTVGGEIVGYTAEFVPVLGLPNRSTADVLLFLGNYKKYFRTRSSLQPYIGAGLGYALTDISGVLNGNTGGPVFQVLGGIEYRSSSIGFFAELKHLSVSTESDSGESIDVSGSGIFAGVSFHF